MYNLFRFAANLVPRLPRRWIPALSAIAGCLAWLVATKARRQANANMRHILGSTVAPARRRRVVRGMFINNVRNYLESFYLPHLTTEAAIRDIQIEGLEHLEAALKLGKGVVLFSAHLGPFDYLSQWVANLGYQLIIPVEQLADRRMLDLMLGLRKSHGVSYLPLGDSTALKAMLQALRKNQLVLITADRAVVGQSVEVSFFGAPARLPAGPASLALRTGAALVGAVGWRVAGSNSRIQGRFIPVSLALPEEQRKDITALQNGVVESIEEVIGEHPDQWVVFAPVWIAD